MSLLVNPFLQRDRVKKPKIAVLVLAAVMTLNDSISLYAQNVAPSGNVLQEITEFEESRRQWERQRDAEMEVLREKQARIDSIKQALLAKIEELKKEKRDWQKEGKQSFSADASEASRPGAFEAEKRQLEMQKAELSQLRAKLTSEREAFEAQMAQRDMAAEAQISPNSGALNQQVDSRSLALRNKEVKRIILTRPAVEAGENLGFLPGDLKEKLDPYFQALPYAYR